MPADEVAREVLEALGREDFGSVVARLGERPAAVLSEDTLRGVWRQTVAMFGEVERVSSVDVVANLGVDQAVATCEASKGRFLLSVAVDASGRIQGLNVMPAVDHPRPSYAPADQVPERELEFHADERYPLRGTLTLPPGAAGPVPAVVLVHGSGPNDRDERLMGAAPFLDLALGLAARGVATFRYDKRTRVHRLGPDVTIAEEVVDDAVAALVLVRGQPEVDPARAFVLGHSLGGTLAPAIALSDGAVRGIVVLAGATRPMHEILTEQVEHVRSVAPAGMLDERLADRLLRQAAALASLTEDTPSDALPGGVPARYWASFSEASPTRLVDDVRCPMLVLQGERDYQVTMRDFEGWQLALQGRADVTFVSYPALNHLFAAGAGPSSPMEYLQPSNVAEEVVDDVARWVLAA